MRILLLEDDPGIARFLAKGLREEGHSAEVAGDLAAARVALAGSDYDALVVDRMLPDGDGLDLVRELRRRGDTTPALCLTARDRVAERVEGLTGGADDYLVKPFAFSELLARLMAITRRTHGGDRVTVLDLSIDVAGHRAFRGERELRLTPKEFALLRTLAENAGRVMSRTRLLERVWDIHHDPGTNVVDVLVGELRAKLDRGEDVPLLHTVRGVGYVLEADAR